MQYNLTIRGIYYDMFSSMKCAEDGRCLLVIELFEHVTRKYVIMGNLVKWRCFIKFHDASVTF